MEKIWISCDVMNLSDEKDSIKREYLDESEEQNVSDEDYKETDISYEKDKIKFQNTSAVSETLEMGNEENISDKIFEVPIDNVKHEGENHILDEARQDCGEINQCQKKIHCKMTSMRNWRSEAFPHCKVLRVGIEDKMLNLSKHNSFKQFTAQSSKDNGTTCHLPIKKEEFESENNFVVKVITNMDNVKRKNKNSRYNNIKVCNPKKASNTDSVKTDTVDSKVSDMQDDNEPSKNVFICDICDKQFHIKSTLTRHIKDHTRIYSCTYCSYKANRTNDIKNHINCVHTKDTVFNCSYCSFKTYLENRLNTHINIKHTKNISYNCSLCSYKVYNKRSLTRHINAAHTKTNIYICSYCSFESYRKCQLSTHINAKHTKNISYSCSLCNYIAYTKSNLSKHINNKHTKIDDAYYCSLCSYKAYDKSTLSRHINSKHTKSDVFNCSHCNYKTYRKCHLDVHINSKHTKNNVYNCSYCSYKAYRKTHLNVHINAKHTKNNVFNCPHCSYKTFRKYYLSAHIKSKH